MRLRRAGLCLALFAFVGAMSLAASVEAAMRTVKLWLLTQSGEKAIGIEVAESEEEKALGLMFRTSLADDRGMLFPYGKPREITMWMRNTYIPLDMVFIRADGVVHRIEERAEPLNERIIGSDGDVSAVLELAGGNAKRLGLKPGDRVRADRYFPAR